MQSINDNMTSCLKSFLLLIFIVSETYEMSVSTSIWNPEVLPVVGEDITLACTYTPPSTQRLLSWHDGNGYILANDTCQGVGCRNEQNVPDLSKNSLRADSSSGNLTISNLTMDDSGTYQCKVVTSSKTVVNGFDLNVMLSVPPTNTLLISSAVTKISGDGVKMIFVHENSSTSFTCVSIGSRPGSRISWNLGNMEIKPKYITYMNDVDEGLYDTESTIRIRPQKNNHKQSIQCSTSLGIAVIHRRKATLIVYGPPIDVRLFSPSKIKEGLRTEVICIANGGYPAPSIHWHIESRTKTNDSSLQASVNVGELFDSTSTLTFTPRRSDHGKRLFCVPIQPTSLTNSSENTSMVLNILYKPKVYLSLRRVINAKRHITLTLKCTSDANPPAVNFIWSCDYSTLFNNTENVVIHDTIQESETLTISEMTTLVHQQESPCNYKCFVFTRDGSGEAAFNSSFSSQILNIWDPPRVTADRKYTTSSSILVTWQPGFNGGLRQSFTLEFCKNDTRGQREKCTRVTNLQDSSFNLTGLEPFTWYRLALWEVSNIGETSSLELIASTAPSPPRAYGINTTLNKLTGVLTFSETNTNQSVEEICFIIHNTTSGSDCSSIDNKECIEPGTEVNVDPARGYQILTIGRGFCSISDSTKVIGTTLSRGNINVLVIVGVFGLTIITVLTSVCVFCIVKKTKARSMGVPNPGNITSVPRSASPIQQLDQEYYAEISEEHRPHPSESTLKEYMDMKPITSSHSSISGINRSRNEQYVSPSSSRQIEAVYENSNTGKSIPHPPRPPCRISSMRSVYANT